MEEAERRQGSRWEWGDQRQAPRPLSRIVTVPRRIDNNKKTTFAEYSPL